jgi:hypothetical protein
MTAEPTDASDATAPADPRIALIVLAAGPKVMPSSGVEPPVVTKEALLAILPSTLSVGQCILKSQTVDAPIEHNGYIYKMDQNLFYGWCCRVHPTERVILKLYGDGACYRPRLVLTSDSVIRTTPWDDAYTLMGSGRTVSQLRVGG